MLIALGAFWGVRGEGKHGFATCAKIAIFLIGIEIWTPEKCPGGDNERINLLDRLRILHTLFASKEENRL